MYNNFHSNYREDEWIARNLKLPAKGTFVDVGACDAIKRSNTYHFEMNGWYGICIEPDKFYFASGVDEEGPNNPLNEHRNISINAAIADHDGEINFVSRGRKCLSQVWRGEVNAKYETIKCFRLETLLNRYDIAEIDILDITCRGYDWIVFNSFDYQKYKPKVIITEWNARNFDNDMRVHDFLIATGEYDLCHTTQADLILKHKSVELL
jgi:FkbM family methyltransferase